MEQDTKNILAAMGVDSDPIGAGSAINKDRSNSEMSTKDQALIDFRKMPREFVLELAELFAFEFEAFGYSYEDYLS